MQLLHVIYFYLFLKVNRLHCRGTTYDVELIVDVNSELFEAKPGDRTTVALASTLSLDGTPDDGIFFSPYNHH